MTTLPGPERVKELREKLVLWSDLRDPSDLVIGRVYADLLALLAARAALRAENERLKKEMAVLEMSEGQAIHEAGMAVEHFRKAEAELAEVRPLIEAVMKADVETEQNGITHTIRINDKGSILRAALAYRQRTERAPAGHEKEKGND